jgi:Calcineurin-like phosphoesterase
MRTLLVAVLLAASTASVIGAQDFEFVVVGDTRPKFASEDFSTFAGLIPKINALNPALVVNLGDLIYGYGIRNTPRQWDKYQEVIKAFRIPYYQIPGNHDTFSAEARRIYGQRFGTFYRSFDYGGCHFVLLDNGEEGRWGYLGSSEVEWLKADLAQTGARSVFVFMHFPVWEPERVAPAYYDFWQNTLHPLFRASRVRAVFGGHYHVYGPTREIDGIRYFITGGGGAELGMEYKEAGGDFHFLRVRVDGDRVAVRVVTEHGELSDAEADVMTGILFANRSSSWIGLGGGPEDLAAGRTFSYSLENPDPEVLTGSASWSFDRSTFDVKPDTVDVTIPPGGTGRYQFTLKALRAPVTAESLPRLAVSLIAGRRHYTFQRDIFFLSRLEAPLQPQPAVVIDGGLEDWAGLPMLALTAAGVPEARVRAVHDGQDLYLAVTVPLPAAAEGTDPFFQDDLQFGFGERLSDTEFGPDRLRLGFTRNGQAVEVKDRTPGRSAGDAIAGVRGAFRRNGDLTTWEIAIPEDLLKRVKAAEKGRLVLNLTSFLPDAGSAGPMPTSPRPNSFAYQVQFGGGNDLSPAHYLEVVLERPRR